MEKVKNRPTLRFSGFNSEWTELVLGAFADIKTGPFGSTLHQEDYVEDGTPIVTVEHLSDYGLVHNNMPMISESDRKRLKSYSLMHNDIVFSRVGSVDRNSLIKPSEEGWLFSGRLLRIRPDKRVVNASYLSKIFQADQTKYRIRSVAVGQTMPSLNTEILKNFTVVVSPTLDEQQKIASFLTAIDDKIQQLSRKKSLLKQYKKGVMHELFSQKVRFKDDEGKEFPDWDEKTLGSICEKKSSNISASSLEGNHGNYIIYGATGVLNKVNFYREEHAYVSIVKDGAGVGRVLICEPKSSVIGTLDIIVNKHDVNLYFLYSCIGNIEFAKYIAGSTIPHIYFRDYSKERLAVPCFEEQTKIANFISTIDDKINRVSKQIEHTRKFKKGLLQQMFI
jgi:type I restriction enzyme S subunit